MSLDAAAHCAEKPTAVISARSAGLREIQTGHRNFRRFGIASVGRLIALGTGAKPVIVKPPKPRAPGELTAEMQEAIREVEKARVDDKKLQDAKGPKKK